MKKIINGRKYDTETAKAKANSERGYYRDFSYVDETLYQKKNGEYFLHGIGGPMSGYAERYGNTRIGGERIIPMTEKQARVWAEEHMSADKYEEIFGEVEE